MAYTELTIDEFIYDIEDEFHSIEFASADDALSHLKDLIDEQSGSENEIDIDEVFELLHDL
jgi:hypothetical protein